jgi:hypothetical protein
VVETASSDGSHHRMRDIAGPVLSRNIDRTGNTEQTLEAFDAGALLDKLSQAARETASPAEFGPRCSLFLRAWNALAVERMETEGRWRPDDLAIAEMNLRHFVRLMKTEAVFLGHANRLDKDCFQAARRRIEVRSI